MSAYDLHLTPQQLDAACVAWEQGGCQLLGLWGARNIKATWGVRRYAELIALVRRELHDDTDYSKENTDVYEDRPDHHARYGVPGT